MPKRHKLQIAPVAKPKRPSRRERERAAWWRALGDVAQVANRLDELGRAQCTDLEAAAVAISEGWAVDPDAPGIVARLAVARLVGLAELRERMHAVALGQAVAEQGQAATAAWLSRQHLGHSPAGVDESTRRKHARLQKLPRHELARVLRAALAQIEGPAILGNLHGQPAKGTA